MMHYGRNNDVKKMVKNVVGVGGYMAKGQISCNEVEH